MTRLLRGAYIVWIVLRYGLDELVLTSFQKPWLHLIGRNPLEIDRISHTLRNHYLGFSGPGAEMRQSLGTAVFYGMIGVTIFGLIFTPAFYVICRWIADRGSRRRPAATQEQPAE